MYAPSRLRPRHRVHSLELGDNAYQKSPSRRKSLQQTESANAAESLKKTINVAKLLSLVISVILLITWEGKAMRVTPIPLSDLGVASNGGNQLTSSQDPVVPASKEVKAMLRRVKLAHLVIPRDARKPSRYMKPNPSLSIPSSVDSFLTDVSEPISPSDVPLFWHILKSGGTTIKDAVGMCLGKVEASESGIFEGHANDQALQKVHISQGQIEYVNGEKIRFVLLNCNR